MAKSITIATLFVSFLVVLAAIFVVIDKKTDEMIIDENSDISVLSQIRGESINSSSKNSILLTRFQGEYDRDSQVVVLSETGEYYIVKEGYVLTNGVHIDARDENQVSVYELN